MSTNETPISSDLYKLIAEVDSNDLYQIAQPLSRTANIELTDAGREFARK